MSWLSNLFGGGGGNPANAAMPYYQQIPGVAGETYDPYINRGREAGDIAQGQYGTMAQDPMAFINKIMEGYQPSKGYELSRDEMMRAARNSAASGGMAGSMQDQENQQKLTQGLLDQDMQQWLTNVLGVQGTGLEGESDFYKTGFGASSSKGSDIMNALGTQGSLAFQGQANKNQSHSDILKSLLGLGGAIGSAPFTGGGSLFGAIGGKLASKWL